MAFATLELFNWPNANLFFAMCTSLPGTIPCALFYYAVILALCTLLYCVHYAVIFAKAYLAPVVTGGKYTAIHTFLSEPYQKVFIT